MGYFPNAAVEPYEVLVMYLKSYHGINKKKTSLTPTYWCIFYNPPKVNVGFQVTYSPWQV